MKFRKLLIWDIDGTLLNCGSAGRIAMDKTFFKMFGIKNGFDDISMAGRLDSAILSDAIGKHKLDCIELEAFYTAYEVELEEVLNHSKVDVLNNVIDILEYCEKQGDILNAIGTGNCEVGAKLKLKHAGLQEFFDFGSYGCGSDTRINLVNRIIVEAKEQFDSSLQDEDIFVIGDTPHDIESGKVNGVKSIAVATGQYSKLDLDRYEPDFIFDNISDLKDFIRAIDYGVF